MYVCYQGVSVTIQDKIVVIFPLGLHSIRHLKYECLHEYLFHTARKSLGSTKFYIIRMSKSEWCGGLGTRLSTLTMLQNDSVKIVYHATILKLVFSQHLHHL